MEEFKYFNTKFGFCYNFNVHFQCYSNYPLKYSNCPLKLSIIKIVEGNRHYVSRFKD